MHAEALPALERAEGEGSLGPALALAVALHLLLAALLWLSSFVHWNRATPAAASAPAIEASLDVSVAEQRAVTRALRFEPEPAAESVPESVPEDTQTAPQPLPEPVPEDSPVPPQRQAQEMIPVPDDKHQVEASREAVSQEKEKQEQEARRRQEQIDLSERQRQEEAERKQRLARQQEEENKKRAAEEKQKADAAAAEKARQERLAQIRAEREKNSRAAALAEQRLKQLEDVKARTAGSSANASQYGGIAASAGADNSQLQGEWVGAMLAAVEQQWIRPPGVTAAMVCPISIQVQPGGRVVSAEVQPSCPYDAAARASVERAVLKASPLPWRGYEEVAQTHFTVRFRASR